MAGAYAAAALHAAAWRFAPAPVPAHSCPCADEGRCGTNCCCASEAPPTASWSGCGVAEDETGPDVLPPHLPPATAGTPAADRKSIPRDTQTLTELPVAQSLEKVPI